MKKERMLRRDIDALMEALTRIKNINQNCRLVNGDLLPSQDMVLEIALAAIAQVEEG